MLLSDPMDAESGFAALRSFRSSISMGLIPGVLIAKASLAC